MLRSFSITQQGERHIRDNTACQDYSASERVILRKKNCCREVIVAAVADGVGAWSYSQYGAEAAVCSYMEYVENHIESIAGNLTDENVINIITDAFHYALSEVEKESEEREIPFPEFDSTLTGIVYDGHNLWFGHIGDDGIVALFSDGECKMITQRHKGEMANELYPLRETSLWQFGKADKEVVSCVLMTDGVLDHCVDVEAMNNRVFFPFLEPALTDSSDTDDENEFHRQDWFEYLSGNGDYPESFRELVTDDITFVVVRNPETVAKLPEIHFDFEKWDEDTEKRKKELADILFADYYAYKKTIGKHEPHNEEYPEMEAE